MSPSGALPYTNAPIPTHCPVTGLPIYGHSSWSYVSPGGNYRLQVSFIGDHIVWLRPQGYVRLKYAQEGFALLEDVLFTMMPKASAFIAIDDYAAVSGASLNARRFIIQRLRQERRLRTYIVYGPSRIFRLGLGLGQRFGLFPFEVVITRDYDTAAAAAHSRLSRMAAALEGEARPDDPIAPHDPVSDNLQPDGSADPLAAFAHALLDAVGGISLEPYGLAPVFRKVPLDHPFRPVYDALALLRDDRQAILQRHREVRKKLESRQKELIAKQALLNETHTTLNVLFAARQEERQRFEGRIKSRFHALLQPLVDGLESTATTARQRDLIHRLNDVIHHIGEALPYETAPLQTPFTARERLIACLLTMGASPHGIARLLGLSSRTVANHCQRMRAKVGLKGRRPTLQAWLALKDQEHPEQNGRRP